MKTTLGLNDALIANAKALAAQQRTTSTRIVEEGLRLRLQATRGRRKAPPVRLPVFAGKGGLAEGIDPSSNKSMLEPAEGDDALTSTSSSPHRVATIRITASRTAG